MKKNYSTKNKSEAIPSAINQCFSGIFRKPFSLIKLPESNFVKKQIGIGNVCQAAILAYNERAKIILPKTKFEKVTVALAWEK